MGVVKMKFNHAYLFVMKLLDFFFHPKTNNVEPDLGKGE